VRNRPEIQDGFQKQFQKSDTTTYLLVVRQFRQFLSGLIGGLLKDIVQRLRTNGRHNKVCVSSKQEIQKSIQKNKHSNQL
jgi:hypothetical protein